MFGALIAGSIIIAPTITAVITMPAPSIQRAG